MKTRDLIMLAAIAGLATVIALVGCKKTAPPNEHEHEHEHEAAAMTQDAAAAAAQIEQKMCPVMTDMKINPDIFTEYKGKKVYFCCKDCTAKFEADPEKYAANLPQFKK